MDKVVTLIPEFHKPFVEGIQKSAFQIVSAATKRGFRVDVFTQKTFGEKIEMPGVNQFFWFSSSRFKLFKYFSWLVCSFNIVKYIVKNSITRVIIFSLDRPFLFFLLLVKFFTKKTDVRLVVFSARELSGFNGLFFRVVKFNVGHFFVRSEYLKNILLSFKVDIKKITVVTVFPEKNKFISKRERHVEFVKRIAYLSNTEDSAGIGTVLYLANNLPDIEFILGIREFSVSENTAVENFLKENNISNIKNIKVVRNITNMADFYQEIDAVILPVKNSVNTMSAPLVLLEALASGCLVFANNVPVFNEYDGLIKLFDNPELLREDLDRGSVLERDFSDKKKDFIDSLVDESAAVDIYFKKYE